MYLSSQNRKRLCTAIAAAALSLSAVAVHAHESEERDSRKWPQASLRAEASAEVAQDTVRITLATEVSDSTQTAVAKALSDTLDATMKQAKGHDKIEATSGNYQVWPMNDKDGKISNWRGRAEIILESKDFAAASELASQLSDRMPIANLAFSVSPQARASQEEALLSEAASAFRQRAKAVAQSLGFADYDLRNVEVGGAGAQYQPSAPRMMAMAADKASVPLEGGRERVTVSIRGSIFLRSPQK